MQHHVPGGKSAIDAVGQFDAVGGIQLGLVSGSADIVGALVLTQDSFINAGLLEIALGALVTQVPDLGLSVSRPGGFFSSDVHIGIGTGLDLAALDNLLLANGSTDPGSVTFNELTGESTLTLPVDISLADFGLPQELIDIDLSFSGQLVANGIVAVPEPATTTWLAFASVGCVTVRRKRLA